MKKDDNTCPITPYELFFDELFISTISTTWQQHRDCIALPPPVSQTPLVNDTIEHTGTIFEH